MDAFWIRHADPAPAGGWLRRLPVRHQAFRLAYRSIDGRSCRCSADHQLARRGGTECKAQITHETAMLKNLGPVAATCGLEVPRLIDAEKTAALSTLIEADVPGRPMAALIREGHHRDLGRIADRLSEWLACWNVQTLRHVEFTPELAERLILSAARPLASSIDRGSAYLDWLMRETGRLVGSQVSLVATHNDLTMANVLGDAAGIRSVV